MHCKGGADILSGEKVGGGDGDFAASDHSDAIETSEASTRLSTVSLSPLATSIWPTVAIGVRKTRLLLLLAVLAVEVLLIMLSLSDTVALLSALVSETVITSACTAIVSVVQVFSSLFSKDPAATDGSQSEKFQ